MAITSTQNRAHWPRRLLPLALACLACGSTQATSGTGGTAAGSGGNATTGAGGATGIGGGHGGASGTGGTSAGGTGGATGTGGGHGGAGTGGAGTGGSTGGLGGTTAGTGGSSGGGGSGAGAVPSAGCKATGSPASGHFTIDVSGTAREYILKLPAGYDGHHPYRLIFAFHGRMYSAQTVADGGPPASGPYYGIESLANGSTIFVAPQALDTSWTDQNGRDVAYVNAMLARFESELCIDQSRVFATGFSFGAIMTIGMACADGKVFRAIAPMSGEIMGTCGGSDPIAYWGSHGTQDPTIPIAMGRAAREQFRMRDGCSAQSIPGDRDGCVNYQGCTAGAPVTWCEFDGVHEPPPYAGDAIWKFLSQF